MLINEEAVQRYEALRGTSVVEETRGITLASKLAEAAAAQGTQEGEHLAAEAATYYFSEIAHPLIGATLEEV